MKTNVVSLCALCARVIGLPIGQRVRHRDGWRGEIVGPAPGHDWLELYRVADDAGPERIAAREFLVPIERLATEFLFRAIVEVGHRVTQSY